MIGSILSTAAGSGCWNCQDYLRWAMTWAHISMTMAFVLDTGLLFRVASRWKNDYMCRPHVEFLADRSCIHYLVCTSNLKESSLMTHHDSVTSKCLSWTTKKTRLSAPRNTEQVIPIMTSMHNLQCCVILETTNTALLTSWDISLSRQLSLSPS